MGGRGGGTLSAVQRAVRAGVGEAAQRPLSHTTIPTPGRTCVASRPTYNGTPKHSRSSCPLHLRNLSSPNLPISAAYAAPTWPSCSSPPTADAGEFDWQRVDVTQDDITSFFDDFVFGSAPSEVEVQHAVSSLQRVLNPASVSERISGGLLYNSNNDMVDPNTSAVPRVSSAGSELDWIEPPLQWCSPRMSQPHGFVRIYDALRLLRTDPSVQRMVISLSSDEAVWDAVLNNEVVRELRGSCNEAENIAPESSAAASSDGSNPTTNILMWILAKVEREVMETMEKIFRLVRELLQPPKADKTTEAAGDPLEELLRPSLLITIVVLLIVVVSRVRGA